MLHALLKLDEIKNNIIYSFEIDSHSILLLKQENNFFLFENKCPHFGVNLDDGAIEKESITCKEHGIRFNLTTGLQMNRFYDECDELRCFESIIKNGMVYVDFK